MLHFAFDPSPVSALKAFSSQTLRQVLELPFVEAVDGELRIAHVFPRTIAASAIGFLEDEAQTRILCALVS